MNNAIDSHFRWVFGRMQIINPKRQLLGLMDAQDWPPKQVNFESFYLLVVASTPIGKSFDSATVPTFSLLLQWVWMVMGTDLQAGVVGRSRGNRIRTHEMMKGELTKALFPRFVEKQDWSVTGNSITSLQLQATSLNPQEFVWWDHPTFTVRSDKPSGIIYGAASVKMTDMTETIAA